MDSGQLQNTLKRLCKVLWEANVTNPITYVTQISYLLFLKILEEMDADQQANDNSNYKSLFGKFQLGEAEIDFESLRWSYLTSDPDNERMLRTLRDMLPQLAEHPLLSQGAKAIFQNASVIIPNGAALRRAVDVIAPISFLTQDADVKGDLFEILVNDLGSQKRAAQFRTPRHLIRVITEMVNPKIGQTVCDPACGTAGFLIAAYEHILLNNTSPEFIRKVATPYGLPMPRGIGDKLTREEWDFLQKESLHGFESDADIMRMAAMNAVLHQFDHSPLVCRDSICGSEDKWDEMQFDVILANPPFSGDRSDAKRSLRIEKGDKYVLFLAYALRSLRPGGRAGIIFPSGILFGDSGSHIQVKKRLLQKFDLQAVVILPKGMFEPYTPNPTCFFIFENNGKPTENVWFYHLEGDGSSLRKARKFGAQYHNDFPELLAKWPNRETEEGRAWLVPASQIEEKNYNLTLSGLGLLEPEQIEYPDPKDILEFVAAKEERIFALVREMQSLSTTVASVFGDGSKDGWVVRKVKDICEKPQYGYTESASQEAVGYKFLRITDIQEGKVNWETVPYCRCDDFEKYLLKSGDILFARTGATTGKSFIVKDPPKAIFASYLIRLRVGPSIMPEFLYWYFQSSIYWAAVSSGIDDGNRPNMNGTKLANLEIPYPIDKTEQRRIIEHLDSIQSKAEELKRLQSETDAKLTSFTPALLAKAFRGEL